MAYSCYISLDTHDVKHCMLHITTDSIFFFLNLRYKGMVHFIERKVLQSSYDIILCTCNETCSRRFLTCLNGKIAQSIVDECGMAHEPETLAAISLAEHAVLIGDHKQLQPVVKYQTARECGLVRSLFERYADSKTKNRILTQLEIQYRMVC